MNHAALVRVLQRFGDLLREAQRLIERQRTLEILTFHQFHHQGVLFQPVNSRDIRMVERRQHLRLALEASHAIAVAGENVWQDLQRHLAFELGIASAIHFTHSPRADRSEDLIGPEPVTRGEPHGLVQQA
jgi:hypothetical protein